MSFAGLPCFAVVGALFRPFHCHQVAGASAGSGSRPAGSGACASAFLQRRSLWVSQAIRSRVIWRAVSPARSPRISGALNASRKPFRASAAEMPAGIGRGKRVPAGNCPVACIKLSRVWWAMMVQPARLARRSGLRLSLSMISASSSYMRLILSESFDIVNSVKLITGNFQAQ